MAVTSGNRVIELTADNDTWGDEKMGRIKFLGARLVATSDTATALIKKTDTNGQVLCNLSCVTLTSDECSIPFTCDSGKIHVDLTGTSAKVYLYLE